MDFQKLPKIELHNHLDGACKLEILMEMCRSDNLSLKRFPYNSPEEFKKIVTLPGPQASLVDFLKPFPEICYILSTRENLNWQAREFCKEQKRQNIIYTEVRLCPFLFIKRGLTPEEVTQEIIKGLDEGQKEFGVKVRLILTFIKPRPDWDDEILEIAIKYRNSGVVGIDIAGDELAPMTRQHLLAFERAHKAGLHITVHAGESGPASNVREAIEVIKAERIGHGYHVLDDESVYKLAKTAGVHFECCLTSSVYTSSANYERHAIKKFAEDKVNFGINTDDSEIIGTTLTKEFESSVKDLGLSEEVLIESVFNSARSCFLPSEEKAALLAQLAVEIAKYKTGH